MAEPKTITSAEIDASKSPRGRKLMDALLKELHRRGVMPVKGEIRNDMRRHVATKLRREQEVGDRRGVVSWARDAVDQIARPRERL